MGTLGPSFILYSYMEPLGQEGPIKPGCNPIIVLMNRIKEVGRRCVGSLRVQVPNNHILS